MKSKQLSLMDAVISLSRRKKVSRAVGTLAAIGGMVDWEALVEVVSVLDKTREGKGGATADQF